VGFGFYFLIGGNGEAALTMVVSWMTWCTGEYREVSMPAAAHAAADINPLFAACGSSP
jgi:hypothetical protein